MASVQVIRCRKCGAPSYADQTRRVFFCPYCWEDTPWVKPRTLSAPDIRFRHCPVLVIDGLLKLTHVGLPEKPPEDMQPEREMTERVRDTAEKLSETGANAVQEWNISDTAEISCRNCGTVMTCSSGQHIFVCKFCGRRLMNSEALADAVYREEFFGYDYKMFGRVMPFSVSREEAKARILLLAEEFPEDFSGQNIKERIDSDLQALYLPYRLEDISLKATTETERGRFTFYHDRINWAIPLNSVFDIHLMNELQPWDFGETAPFAPAYLEGDVQIFAPANNETANLSMLRMLRRAALSAVKDSFGFKNAELLTWDYNFRKHHNAYFSLPIWFLEKRRDDGEQELQVRAAVNGQTGKAAALFLKAGETDYIRTSTAVPVPEMSDVCTLFSPPIPVKYAKSPFLFRKIALDEAFAE